MYKIGQTVTILNQDIAGKPVIEGEAMLVEDHTHPSHAIPYWKVRFLVDNATVMRSIYPQEDGDKPLTLKTYYVQLIACGCVLRQHVDLQDAKRYAVREWGHDNLEWVREATPADIKWANGRGKG